MTLTLPIDPEANALLQSSQLALVIAMLLDQQVSMERAFSAPYDLVQRLGHEPTAAELAGYDPEALIAIFSKRPALHRYPRAMAARVQDLCRMLVEGYDGDAARIWADATTGKDLLARVAQLPGFGPQKAQIFVALLGKQFGVQPTAGARLPGRSAPTAPTARWPISPMTSRLGKYGHTSRK